MRAAAALIAVACAGCDALLHLDDIRPPLPVVSYRKPIAITTDTMLDDVPVSIALDADPDLAAHAQSNGGDLVFSDGTNELASEIVSYSAGTLDAWVRVPALAAGTTMIELDYGGAARTIPAAMTWPAEYVGVWHESDQGTTARDSTLHAHDLIPEVAAPSSTAGIAGGASEYGPTQQDMCANDVDSSLELDAMTSFSFSLWAYEDQAPTLYNVALFKGGAAQGNPGFDLELHAAWVGNVVDELGNELTVTVAANPPMNRWAQVLVVVDRTNNVLIGYLDGSLIGMGPLPAGFDSLASSAQFCLGGQTGGGSWYAGKLDEGRVVLGVPSAERIRFEHDNLAARDRVISVGAEEEIR